MVTFRTRVTSSAPSGSASPGNPAGSASVLGRVARDDLDGLIPRPRDVAREFARRLRLFGSEWPSTGFTDNRGPQATGRSARAFRAVQGRDAAGRFTSWQIINTARNDQGRPYAGLVDAGIYNWRASSARRTANRRAVERTWERVGASILDKLTRGQ